MNFAEKLRESYSRDVFDEHDLKIACVDMSRTAIHSGLSRALRSGDIIKLKRGFYIFGQRLQRESLSKFSIANNLYIPSYISFESALSYHGLIPEAVYSTTSACLQRKSKSFKSSLGEFTYDFIPCQPFFLGVETVKSSNVNFIIANPLRALFDLAYQRKKNYNTLQDLDADLRIDLESLITMAAKYTSKELEALANSYKKTTVKQLCNILIKELS